MTFAFTGAISTMLFIFVSRQVYVLGALLVIVGVVCLGSSFVLLNSFIPVLAANHPKARRHVAEDAGEPSVNGYSGQESESAKISPELKMSTQISSKGVGLGYAAAVSVEILSIGLLVLLKQAHFSAESTPLRCVLFMVGTFWACLTIPGALWLRNRAGPSIRVTAPWKTKLPAAFQYVAFAWRSLWKTITTAAKLRQNWVFLLAWFLLSDAIATVSGTAILFARTELHMGTIAVAMLSIVATLSGIAGAFAWPLISKRLGLQTRSTIMACMVMMEIVPLYGMLGFLPFIRAWGVGGLQQAWEVYPLGFVHGFVMGGISSYCRAFYGQLVPPGSEAAFYALFAITDKGSSAVGPAIVGALVDNIGTIRPAFVFLAILIALPIPLVYIVDVRKGREDAAALSKHLRYAGDQGIRMQDYEETNEGELEAGEGLLGHQED
jgi:MFS transporter, UMF1 family